MVSYLGGDGGHTPPILPGSEELGSVELAREDGRGSKDLIVVALGPPLRCIRRPPAVGLASAQGISTKLHPLRSKLPSEKSPRLARADRVVTLGKWTSRQTLSQRMGW